MDAGRTEEMVKLVIAAMVEAETGDYEEILESCVLHSTNVRILCFFWSTHPSLHHAGVVILWFMIMACSMLIDVKEELGKGISFLTYMEQGVLEASLVQKNSIHF